MYKVAKLLSIMLNSKFSIYFIILFILGSLIVAKTLSDMNIFAASGSILTIFGLFKMIHFTTIERFLKQDEIIHASTGVTGPPISDKEYELIVAENRKKAKEKLGRELKSEISGIIYTILGTLIWAYGIYIPV